jgi:hypothetical protein
VAKFPEPPPLAQLAALSPAVRTLPAGTRLWRIYFQSGRHPTAWNAFRQFGPISVSRFDHHLPPAATQGRGILYASPDGSVPFAEVFQDGRVIDRTRDGPWLVAFDLEVPVALLDLAGAWPTRAGASAAINSGPRPRARRWSQRIYEAYPVVVGLWYRSSMGGNRPAVALYERAAPALPARPVFHRSLADSALTAIVLRAARRFGYAVVA